MFPHPLHLHLDVVLCKTLYNLQNQWSSTKEQFMSFCVSTNGRMTKPMLLKYTQSRCGLKEAVPDLCFVYTQIREVFSSQKTGCECRRPKVLITNWYHMIPAFLVGLSWYPLSDVEWSSSLIHNLAGTYFPSSLFNNDIWKVLPW